MQRVKRLICKTKFEFVANFLEIFHLEIHLEFTLRINKAQS